MELALKKKGVSAEKEPVAPLIGEVDDYNFYYPSVGEIILWFFIGMAASGVVLYIFYENVFVSVIVGAVCGVIFVPIRKKQVIEKRKKKLNLQFRSMLDALATSIGAGKNMYDSFSGAADDLSVQYGEKADIVREAKVIRVGLDHNIQVEDLLMNFAERSGVVDVQDFANVFATCYKKGGNIKDVIKNTASIIGDKIEIQMELETMVSGQKNEQNIMLVMPIGLIAVMKSMGGGMIDLKSGPGILGVTIALGIFIIAYGISKKILDIKL